MNNIVMIGSSIFELWGKPNWGNIQILNKAIGGTTTVFWAENIRQYILPDFDHYAIYCGSNDLNHGISADLIVENTCCIFETLRASNNNVHIAYFSIMKGPQKRDKFALIDQIHSEIKPGLSDGDLFVDLNFIIGSDPQWYIEDGVHLTQSAYAKMDIESEPLIHDWIIR